MFSHTLRFVRDGSLWMASVVATLRLAAQGSFSDIAITALDDYEQWQDAKAQAGGTAASAFQLASGFEISLVRSALPVEGSWISLRFDPQGRAIVAMEKKGLLRMTLAADRLSVANVEVINDTLPEVRGLVFGHGALYANVNTHNQKTSGFQAGLYRLRDTDGDDRFDEVKLVGPSTRSGGHGRNDITLGPDGMIYMMHGDSVSVPDSARRLPSPVPPLNPGDDRAHGHLIRTDAGGTTWEVVAHGLRNPFGIAFNEHGEAFTYDADAEHDMGAPWYRPTRLRHLVSGADYGWRSVTGIWPPYFPDHADEPPNTFDIGKGSPTALEFGTRSQFPPAWKRALYILDWTYGRILAAHLTPQGASYAIRAETFLRGRPANVTDLDFGPDGALYFVTGGRGTQSGLYRVHHTGTQVNEAPPAAGQLADDSASAQARQLRRQLEKFHGRTDPGAVDFLWPHLDHTDRWIRHAARVALEHQPARDWQGRALAETNSIRSVTALLALARVAEAAVQPRVIERILATDWRSLPEEDKLAALRTVEIAWQRSGTPEPELAAGALKKLDALYPDSSGALNRELAKLLCGLGAYGVVPRTLALMERAQSQEERMHYLFALRNVREGWTGEDRRRYFRALALMDAYRGGAGLPKFIGQIRREALAAVPAAEQPVLQAMLETPRATAGEQLAAPRPFVRHWTMADLPHLSPTATHPTDLQRGRRLFREAQCGHCHTLGEEGRPFGPDLTNVASRFSRRDLLESILEPSKVVAEGYRGVAIVTKDGGSHTGQVVLEGDYRAQVLRLVTDPLQPFRVTEIRKADIASHRESEVSPMPEGLLDSFTREEILDLLAFLEKGGKPARGASNSTPDEAAQAQLAPVTPVNFLETLGVALSGNLLPIEDWLQVTMEESLRAALDQLDNERAIQFLDAALQRMQHEQVYDMAALKDGAAALLPVLEQYEETLPYALWLRTRLDYFDAAGELRRKMTTEHPDREASAPLPVPTPAMERTEWDARMEKRPLPPNAPRYLAQLKAIFIEEGVPPQLVWVAEVESTFDPRAKSPSGAAGMFQLMKPTAESLGLSTWFPDERLDAAKNARAAAVYLRHLHRRFGDWRLALAAYNAGETRVSRLLQQAGQRSFYAISSRLPAETQMYVPKVEATLRKRESVELGQLAAPKD